MVADLLIFILGGSVGFFTAALCKAAGRADEKIEQMQMVPQTINTVNTTVDSILGIEVIDSSEESINK